MFFVGSYTKLLLLLGLHSQTEVKALKFFCCWIAKNPKQKVIIHLYKSFKALQKIKNYHLLSIDNSMKIGFFINKKPKLREVK